MRGRPGGRPGAVRRRSGRRSRGLNKIIGPKGFTALDGMGLLVKGFSIASAFGLPYNPAYYIALVESAGFESAVDGLRLSQPAHPIATQNSPGGCLSEAARLARGSLPRAA
jgi:hypothetical protein